MEKFFQALAALLPTGFAWPRDAGSTLMRVIHALAGTFSEHHDFTTEAVRQWQPATTVNRLAEWEAATSLPDACFPTPLELLLPGRYLLDAGRIASSTRGTPATYVDAAGVLQTAAANVPRFEGGQLVVEQLATNLLRNSEADPGWVALGTAPPTVNSQNTTVDGVVCTSTTFAAITGGTFAVCRATGTSSPGSINAGVTVIQSSWIKLSRALVAGEQVTFFVTGVFGGSNFVLNASNSAQFLAWARAAGAPLTPTVSGADYFVIYPQTLNSPLTVFSSLRQLEAGTVATSYIATTGASVTRAADQIYLFPTEAATRDLRRQLLLSRLRGPVLAYTNSSPASPDAIVAICAGLGYVSTVSYNLPFRCGVNRVGDRLGALDGRLYVTVTLQSKAFRVGVSRVGQRLLEGQLNGGELACYLQRVIPARYQLNMIFI